MSIFDKVLDRIKVSHKTEYIAGPVIPTESHWNTPPSQRQIYVYRMHRGVNLGGWFTLETWLTPSLFQGVYNAKSEYDLCKQLAVIAVKDRLEKHWSTFVDDGDWTWMKKQGITTIRLPISYYHYLAGHPSRHIQGLIKGTEYEDFAKIYQSAYSYIVQAVEKASQYGIGVLIDLHAAPGAQNSEGHSGLSTGQANFYNGANMKKTIDIISALVDTFGKYDNVVGVELINEPQDNAKLANWYKEAISTLRRECSYQHLPLILGDCWNMQKYADVISSHEGKAGPLLLDHHLYRCFTAQDCQTSALEHAASIHPRSNDSWYKQICSVSSQLQHGIIIGEWSAALNPASLKDCQGHEWQHQKVWARAQLDAFNAHCAGQLFWTKEGARDVGWCLYSAIEQGILPSGLGRPKRGVDVVKLQQRGDEMGKSNFDDHVQYWAQNGRGAKMHHEKYRDGFQQMYKDCLDFYQSCSEEIGFAGLWVAQRARAYSQ